MSKILHLRGSQEDDGAAAPAAKRSGVSGTTAGTQSDDRAGATDTSSKRGRGGSQDGDRRAEAGDRAEEPQPKQGAGEPAVDGDGDAQEERGVRPASAPVARVKQALGLGKAHQVHPRDAEGDGSQESRGPVRRPRTRDPYTGERLKLDTHPFPAVGYSQAAQPSEQQSEPEDDARQEAEPKQEMPASASERYADRMARSYPETSRFPAPAGDRRNLKARLRRVPGIDGLRGVAVLAVVLYHFFGTIMPGGFLGVDVFFVLSGFLITSLLVREYAVTGRVNLKKFWLRRVRRILPAALVVLMVVTAVAGTVGGDPAVGLPSQFLGTLFFANNWVQIAESQSYFADSGVQVFAHYWSLAVEEQFYLIWPLLFIVVMWLARRARRRNLPVAVTLVLALCSAAWMAVSYRPDADPTRVYYGTDTHAFGLLIGVALALWLTSHAGAPEADSWPPSRSLSLSQRRIGVAGAIAFLGVCVLFAVMPDTQAVTCRGGMLVASLLTAVALFAVIRESGPLSLLMRVGLLRWLGERSFSLYLWHWPVMILVTEIMRRMSHEGAGAQSQWTPGLMALAISLPLSALSYRWVETPIRRHGYVATLSWLNPKSPESLKADARGQRLGPRRVAVAVAALVIAVASGAGMARAPQQTQLEADLSDLANQQDQQSADEAKKLQDLRHRKMPEGQDITAIGDSVMLASSQALGSAFPGIYVDGAVSRHYEAAPAIVDGMLQQGTLDQFVVLGFGTNGEARPGELEALLDQVGPERIVVLVSPYGDRYWMPHAREQINQAAKERKNVFVADWCYAAQANPGLLRGDAIHPTPDGAGAYAEAVKAAFRQWVNDEKKVPGTCGV